MVSRLRQPTGSLRARHRPARYGRSRRTRHRLCVCLRTECDGPVRVLRAGGSGVSEPGLDTVIRFWVEFPRKWRHHRLSSIRKPMHRGKACGSGRVCWRGWRWELVCCFWQHLGQRRSLPLRPRLGSLAPPHRRIRASANAAGPCLQNRRLHTARRRGLGVLRTTLGDGPGLVHQYRFGGSRRPGHPSLQ